MRGRGSMWRHERRWRATGRGSWVWVEWGVGDDLNFQKIG